MKAADTQSITDLQKIQSAGKHLLALINGILDLVEDRSRQDDALAGSASTCAR